MPSLLKLFVEFNTYFQYGNVHRNNPTDNTFPCETLFSQSKQKICLSQVISREIYIVFSVVKQLATKSLPCINWDVIVSSLLLTTQYTNALTTKHFVYVIGLRTCSPNIWKWLDGKKFRGQPKLDKAEGHLTSDNKHETSNIGHLTSDNKHYTSDMRHQTSDINHQTSDIRDLTSDNKHQISDTRH